MKWWSWYTEFLYSVQYLTDIELTLRLQYSLLEAYYILFIG